MQSAYGLQEFQVVGGPRWIDSDGYNIEAKAEGSASKSQIRLMLQSLFEDRFNLKALTERAAPLYAFDPSSISGNFPTFDRDVGADDVEERIIAPIPNKSKGLKQVFIRDTYTKADALLQASDIVVTIGYSFNRYDGASYERLRGALGQSVSRKMLVVSPDADAIVEAIRPAHPKISIAPMEATFRQWVAASFPGIAP